MMSVRTDSLKIEFFRDMTLCNWIVTDFWGNTVSSSGGSKYWRKIFGHSDP